MKASFLFCRTSLSLHRKAAFLMPPKVQLENSFCIAKAYGFIYVSFILLTWNECINNTSPSNMSISAVAVAVASIWLCFFPFVIHFFSKKYVLMLGVMFQKKFMLLDALCGILLLGKKNTAQVQENAQTRFPFSSWIAFFVVWVIKWEWFRV